MKFRSINPQVFIEFLRLLKLGIPEKHNGVSELIVTLTFQCCRIREKTKQIPWEFRKKQSTDLIRTKKH